MENLVSAVARIRNARPKAAPETNGVEHDREHQSLQQEGAKSPRKRTNYGSEFARKKRRKLYPIISTPASSGEDYKARDRSLRPEESEADNDDDYNSGIDTDLVDEPVQEDDTFEIYSTFVPSKDNVLVETKDEWRIRLTDGESISLIGQYGFWVIEGSITILGATIHGGSRPYKVYAPSNYSIPLITHFRDPSRPNQQPAIIQFENLWTGVRELPLVSPFFQNIPNGNKTPSAERSFHYIAKQRTNAHNPWQRPLIVPQEWQAIVDGYLDTAIATPKIMMVTGPKNAGKSTLSRLLINRAITTTKDGIALLDLDPGQPEFSPPGNISLVHLKTHNFGPPFTHPLIGPGTASSLIRAHHIGSSSPRQDPALYIQCAINFFSHYQRLLTTNPLCSLVVNCCGWTEDSGLQLLVDFVRLFKPTDLVFMQKSQDESAVSALRQAASIAGSAFYCISALSATAGFMDASNLRDTVAQSYFHVDSFHFPQLHWNDMPIHTIEPLSLKYTGDDAEILGFMAMGPEYSVKYIADLVNASILGAVVVDDESVDLEDILMTYIDPGSADLSPDSSAAQTAVSYPAKKREVGLRHTEDGFPYFFVGHRRMNTPLDPSKTRCIGQVLVRAIDFHLHTVQVITPIPAEEFQRNKGKLFLVRGSLDVPVWAFEEELHARRTLNEERRDYLGSSLVRDPESCVTDSDFDEDEWYNRRPYITAPSLADKGPSRFKAHELARGSDS